jgi:hypothetical protein
MTLPNLLNGVIAIGLIVAGYLWMAPKLRKRSAKNTLRNEVEREYVAFARCLQRQCGRRRAPSETADEFLAAISVSLQGGVAEAQELNKQLVGAMYSSAALSEPTVSSLRVQVRKFVADQRKIRPAAK